MEEVLSKDDEFVIVRGIAGIGKTSLVDSYVLKWAQGELLNGKNNSPHIVLLFKLVGRNLNTVSNVSTGQELLRMEFFNVLKNITLEDLDDISHRILILIDGADELQSIHELRQVNSIHQKQENLTSLIQSVYKLIDTTCNLLNGHKTIIAARPEACQIIDSVFKSRIEIKTVEVCGFNTKNVHIYVDKYYGKDTDKAQRVKEKIEESENLTVMASIPVYTWVICAMFNEDISIETPRTTTRLCSYACLLFVRNHLKRSLRDPFSINCPLIEITANKDVLQLVLCLAQLSYYTLKKKLVVFSNKDLQFYNGSIALEDTGFIVKDQRKNIFQFRHLVLQEYFAALYFYLGAGDLSKIFCNANYVNCIPIISGLSGMENGDSSDTIACFVKYLKTLSHHNKLERFFSRRSAKTIIQDWLKAQFQNLLLQDKLIINENSSSLLAAYYECQSETSQNIIECLVNVPVVFTNIMFHHDIRNAIYLLTKLKLTEFYQIDVINISNKKFPQNMVDLLKLYFKEKGNNDLYLTGSHQMRMFSTLNVKRSLTIQLDCSNEELETHKDLLLSAIIIVDRIYLDYTLNNLYPHLIELIKLKRVTQNVKYCGALPSYGLTPSHIEMFSDNVLAECNEPHSFNARHSFITDKHIECLQPCIAYLTEINISFRGLISPISMKYISNAVISKVDTDGRQSLKTIDISGCDLTDQHIEYLQPCIPYLEKLNIASNKLISPISMKHINDAIIKMIEMNNIYNLKTIDVSGCDLSDEHIKGLRPYIPYLITLSTGDNMRLSSEILNLVSGTISTKLK